MIWLFVKICLLPVDLLTSSLPPSLWVQACRACSATPAILAVLRSHQYLSSSSENPGSSADTNGNGETQIVSSTFVHPCRHNLVLDNNFAGCAQPELQPATNASGFQFGGQLRRLASSREAILEVGYGVQIMGSGCRLASSREAILGGRVLRTNRARSSHQSFEGRQGVHLQMYGS